MTNLCSQRNEFEVMYSGLESPITHRVCVCVCVCVCVYVCMLSCFNHVQFIATLWTIDCQSPLSMGVSRQERLQSVLPCPPPGDLPDPKIESTSLTFPALSDRFFNTLYMWVLCFLGLIFFSCC